MSLWLSGSKAKAPFTVAEFLPFLKEEALVDGMRPDFKAAMDSYETFFEYYCEFMENYDTSNLSMLQSAEVMIGFLMRFRMIILISYPLLPFLCCGQSRTPKTAQILITLGILIKLLNRQSGNQLQRRLKIIKNTFRV